MDILKELGTDRGKESRGVWRDLGDARFLVAGIGSQEYQAERVLLQRELRLKCKADGNRDATVDEMIDADCRLYARTILLGWEGVTRDGVEVDGGDEEARFAMLRGAPRFFNIVRGWAHEFAPYQIGADEGAQGN